MQNILDFNNKPVYFEYNGKIYYLYERDEINSCSVCVFSTIDDSGESCNDAKSESISCYASCGKRFWKD